MDKVKIKEICELVSVYKECINMIDCYKEFVVLEYGRRVLINYEKKLEAKDDEIKFIKDNAQKIIEIRSELSDFAKDLSDEELFNEDKIRIARLEKENTELKNKEESKETTNASDESTEEEVLETGHEEVDVESNEEKPLNSYIKKRYNQNKK